VEKADGKSWNPFAIIVLSSLKEEDTIRRKGMIQNIASTVSVTYPIMESTSRSALPRLRLTSGGVIVAVVELIGHYLLFLE
jgi:hypothetical protein